MRLIRRWWLTAALNGVLVLSLALGCHKGLEQKAEKAPRVELPYPPVPESDTVLVDRDERNPVERQDHWWWPAPLEIYGEVSHYVVEYQCRGGAWRHLGLAALNTAPVPQRYAPYRIRVTAYYSMREWMPDKSPGYGVASVPSEWAELYVAVPPVKLQERDGNE